MNRLLIFPFSIEIASIARYHKDLVDYEEVICVTLQKLSNIADTDVSYFDGGTHCGVKVTNDFTEALKLSNDILFYETGENADNLIPYVEEAVALEKNLIFTSDTNISELSALYDGKHLTNRQFYCDVSEWDRLKKIKIPIVMVAGLGNHCNKFDVQLGLREKFLDCSYKVSQVGTKAYSSLFGFDAVPIFHDIPLWKKILFYNRYFSQLVKLEKSDVLIVGIPGGIMQIDKWHNEYFGETAIAISKSLSPDLAILSIYENSCLSAEEVNHFSKYFEYTLTSQLNYFHTSNVKMMINVEERLLDYLVINHESTKIEQLLCGDTFNVFCNESSQKTYNKIISELQNNIEII